MARTTIGKVESTRLGREDHGIPTFMVHMDFGTHHQGFGGYDLRFWGNELIQAVIDACGVSSWEDLPGSVVEVVTTSTDQIRGLQPLPFNKGTGFYLHVGDGKDDSKIVYL